MTSWTEMHPMHFDKALAPSKSRARKWVAAADSAGASLFPDLLPDLLPELPDGKHPAPPADPCGTASMFDLDAP